MPFNKQKGLEFIQQIDNLIGDHENALPYGNALGGACAPKKISARGTTFLAKTFTSAPKDDEAKHINACFSRLGELITRLGLLLQDAPNDSRNELLAASILAEINLVIRQLPQSQAKLARSISEATSDFSNDIDSLGAVGRAQASYNRLGASPSLLLKNLGENLAKTMFPLHRKLTTLRDSKSSKPSVNMIRDYYGEVPALNELSRDFSLKLPEDPVNERRMHVYEAAMEQLDSINQAISELENLLIKRERNELVEFWHPNDLKSDVRFGPNHPAPIEEYQNMLIELLNNPITQKFIMDDMDPVIKQEERNAESNNRKARTPEELIRSWGVYDRNLVYERIEQIIGKALAGAKASPPTFPPNQIHLIETLQKNYLTKRGFPDPAVLEEKVKAVNTQIKALTNLLRPPEQEQAAQYKAGPT